MFALIQVLQMTAGMAWLVPAVIMSPGVWRVWRGRADPIDAFRVPIFTAAVVQVGFSARWLIWPHTLPAMGGTELAAWAALYTLSTITAVMLTIAHYFAERLR